MEPLTPRYQLLVAIAIALVSLCFNLYYVPRTAFNPDESRWLHRAHYLGALFDPGSSTWDDQYLTRGQPPLGSYVTGLGLLLQGRDLTTNGSWDFAYDAGTNAELGNMPTYDDLMTARRTSAALMAATVVIVFIIGARLTSWIGGLLGSFFLAVHPFASYIGSLATADALFGLLIALATLAAIRLAERPSWSRTALLGMLLGLGAATKLSPLFVGIPLAVLGVILIVGHRRRRRTRAMAWQLLSVPVVALLTFVAVYPYLWPAPIVRIGHLFAFRVEEMAAQSQDWPVMAVPTRAEALARIGENFAQRFSIAGRLETTIGAAVGTDLSLPRFELALALLGTLVLTALAIKRGVESRAMMATMVLGGQVAITVLGMRSEFDRYHLPMAIAAAVCVGVLAGALAPFIGKSIHAWHVARRRGPITTTVHSQRRTMAGMAPHHRPISGMGRR